VSPATADFQWELSVNALMWTAKSGKDELLLNTAVSSVQAASPIEERA